MRLRERSSTYNRRQAKGSSNSTTGVLTSVDGGVQAIRPPSRGGPRIPKRKKAPMIWDRCGAILDLGGHDVIEQHCTLQKKVYRHGDDPLKLCGVSLGACSVPAPATLLARPVHLRMDHSHVPRQGIIATEGFLLGTQVAPDLKFARIVNRILMAGQIVRSGEN